MITLRQLHRTGENTRVCRVDGRLAKIVDFWDGSGRGMCEEEPIYIRVREYDGQREYDVENGDRVIAVTPEGET